MHETTAEPARDQAPQESDDAWAQAARSALLLAMVGASLGYLYAFLTLDFRPSALLLDNILPPEVRRRFFALVVAAGAVGALIALALQLRASSAADPHKARALLQARLRSLRVLAFLWLVPLVFDTQLWAAKPLLVLGLSFAAAVVVSSWLSETRLGRAPVPELPPAAAVAILVAAMAAYAAYVARYTIQNHHQLGTSAYDLGIMENVFWNTAHGRFFASAIENGNHLGVHTSFIYLPWVAVYALAPRPETLLVIQTLVFALAAWPLFLVARTLLGSATAAVATAVLYLVHPAVCGANFYDFHELAFAPPLFFAAIYFWLRRHRLGLWTSVALLLLVKEDMSLLVVLVGLWSWLGGRRREGAALAGTGILAYLVLQHLVIPHYAHGPHDYTWYYQDMIPAGEGPLGLARTLVVNPLWSLAYALSARKVLYLGLLTTPLALVCFAGRRGLALMAYGLLMAACASREPVYSLGFQYALLLVPPAFVAALTHASAFTPVRRRQAAIVAVTMSLIVAYHHGMLYPRHAFAAGFHRIDFGFDQAQRQRSAEVERVAAELPPQASVTASETLVPHVARRERVQTLRFANRGPARRYDRYLVLRSDLDAATQARFPEVFTGRDYELVYEGQYMLVYARREPAQ